MARRWLMTAIFAALAMSITAAWAGAAPRRVVSMNLCTDQLAMLIAAPGQLVSVSFLARDRQLSAMAREAQRYSINYGHAEEIFLLNPDLVIAGTLTSRATVALLRKLGLRVEDFPLANSLDAVRANIRRMGELLGRRDVTSSLIEEFDARISAARAGSEEPRPTIALLYANSYTQGGGTLVDSVVSASGLTNLGRALGLHGMSRLSLELLVSSRPDLLMLGRPDNDWPSGAHEIFRHPAIRGLAKRTRQAAVPENLLACGTPLIARAVEILAAARAAAFERSPQ